MKNLDNNNQIPAQVMELLPLYALGLLEAEEKQMVQASLEESTELQLQLKEEQEMVHHLREEIGLQSISTTENTEKRLGNLLKKDEFQTKVSEKNNTTTKSKISSFFQSLFPGPISKPQYFGVATITTLSLALLFAISAPLFESKSTFYPAAVKSKVNDTEKNTLLIGLSVAPDNPKLLTVLEKHGAKTTSIVGKDGMYRLSLKNDNSNKADLNSLKSILMEQKELVWFVGEAY